MPDADESIVMVGFSMAGLQQEVPLYIGTRLRNLRAFTPVYLKKQVEIFNIKLNVFTLIALITHRNHEFNKLTAKNIENG